MSDASQADEVTTKATAPLPQRRNAEQPRVLKEVRKHRSFSSFRTIVALVLREMQTSNSRVSGGYFWAIAEPVGGIIILTLIFSAGFRVPPMGTNFAIFYATGVVPFMAYLDISSKVSGSISFSAALLQYPAVTFMDALLARTFFNVITQILVTIIVFSGIIYLFDTRTDPQPDMVFIALLMTFTLAAGVGTVNAFMFSAFPWWQKLWGILMRPLLLLSCILFIFDDVPQPYRDWLWWNPLVHIVGQMRRAFYPSYYGGYVSFLYVFAVSLSLIAIGLVLLIRFHRDLQNS